MLNTLYVTTPQAYLSKDGLNVVVSVKNQEIFRMPIVNLEAIVTFGYMGASPGLMMLCSQHGVALTFLSPNGRFIARVQGGTHGNVLLRKTQYALSDNEEFSLHLSGIIVAGKIHNYASIVKRRMRDYGTNDGLDIAVRALKVRQRSAQSCTTLDELRGIEGDAASIYFGVMHHLIINQKADFPFSGRNRRPPKDEVNAMLSFAYTLLTNDVASALETVGLDPYVGFLHTLRPGRTSLALDLVEELRAYLGDRLVLSLINRRQISKTDFISQGDQGILLKDEARKTFIGAWQSRKKEEITHPYLGEKIPIGLLPYAQAMLLARYMRGDIDDYPVFLIP